MRKYVKNIAITHLFMYIYVKIINISQERLSWQI